MWYESLLSAGTVEFNTWMAMRNLFLDFSVNFEINAYADKQFCRSHSISFLLHYTVEWRIMKQTFRLEQSWIPYWKLIQLCPNCICNGRSTIEVTDWFFLSTTSCTISSISIFHMNTFIFHYFSFILATTLNRSPDYIMCILYKVKLYWS